MGLAGIRDGIPELIRLLEDPVPDAAAHAVLSLCLLGAAGEIERVGRLLDHPDRHVRREAIGFVGAYGSCSSADRILPFLGDPDLAGATISALTDPGAREHRSRIVAFLDLDSSPGSTVEAIRGAILLGPPTEPELSRIASFLDHPDLGLRIRAIEALVLAGSPVAVGAVLALLAGPDSHGRRKGLHLVRALEGRAAKKRVLALIEDPDREVRVEAAIELAPTLEAGAREESIRRLQRTQRASSGEDRLRAAVALVALGAKDLPAQRALARDVASAEDPSHLRTRLDALLVEALTALHEPEAFLRLRGSVRFHDLEQTRLYAPTTAGCRLSARQIATGLWGLSWKAPGYFAHGGFLRMVEWDEALRLCMERPAR